MEPQPSFDKNEQAKKKLRLPVILFALLLIAAGILWITTRSVSQNTESVAVDTFQQTEDQQPKELPFTQKNNIPDPRFDSQNFAKSVNLYDIDPCLNIDLVRPSTCTQRHFEKEVAPGIRAVLDLTVIDTDTTTLFLSFSDANGAITSIPKVDVSEGYFPGVTFVDRSFILLTYSCDECSESYHLFEKGKWEIFSSWGLQDDVVSHLIPMDALFFGKQKPPFKIEVSDSYIKVQERGYCCDTVFWDVLNDKRLEYVGSYEFLFDRKTHELLVSDFVGPYKEDESGNRQALMEYSDWLLHENTESTMDELLGWQNTVAFQGLLLPAPSDWTSTAISDDIDEGIHYVDRDKTNKQTINFYPSNLPHIIFHDIVLLDFKTIRLIHILQDAMPEYLWELAKKSLYVTEWQTYTSLSYEITGYEFSFAAPLRDTKWNVSEQRCSSQLSLNCIYLSPWADNLLFRDLQYDFERLNVVVREIGDNKFSAVCTNGTCTLSDPTANFRTDAYPSSILTSTQSFTHLGKPYIVAKDSDGTLRYYFKFDEKTYLGVTFRGIQDIDPTFVQEFLNRIEKK